VFGSPLKFLTRAFFHISFLKEDGKEVGEEKFINNTDYLYSPVGNYRLHKLIRFSATEGLIIDIRSKNIYPLLEVQPCGLVIQSFEKIYSLTGSPASRHVVRDFKECI
jgi:hypothetical protein